MQVHNVVQDKMDLSTIKDEDLPSEMQKMSPKERETYLDSKQVERRQIQGKIDELNEKRSRYVAEQEKKTADTTTFDSAMADALREQAGKRNFRFDSGL